MPTFSLMNSAIASNSSINTWLANDSAHRDLRKGGVMTEQSSYSPEVPVESRMLALIVGFMATPAIAVAARLGIADLVAAAPRTLDELASETKAHAPSLHRLLQFLTNMGILPRTPPVNMCKRY
jgi:hypothetical protein